MKWNFWRKESTLAQLDPHMLAYGMFERMGKHEFPFNKWRGDRPIPEQADNFVEIAVNIYQLSVFLDCVEQKFGSDVSDIVRSHLITIMKKAGSVSLVEGFFDSIQVGRATPERDPVWADKPDFQVDCNIPRAILSICSESEEEKHALYPVLAQSLSLGKISAEASFKGLVDQIDFRPEATVGLRKPEDIPPHWSEVCGCFERQLQRRHNSPLFSLDLRRVTTAELIIAKARDLADLRQLEEDSKKLNGEIADPGGQKLTFSDVYKWREAVETLLMRAFAVGDIANQQRKYLRTLYESILQSLRDSCPPEKREQLEKAIGGSNEHLGRFGNQFLQQMTRSDTPIASGELLPSLLTEDVETVRLVASTISKEERNGFVKPAMALIEKAKEEGYSQSFLYTCLDNISARAIHGSCGMTRTASRSCRYYRKKGRTLFCVPKKDV